MLLYFLCVMLCGRRSFINILRYLTHSLWVNKNGYYPEIPDLITIRLQSAAAVENEPSDDFKN